MRIVIICLLFVGCFSPKKAQKQFGKVAATYPEIPADYCARVYPVKTQLIPGKDSIRVDTVWGTDVIVKDSIVRQLDTVRIYYTTQLPGKVITKTILRTDTIYQVNTAKSDLCEIEREKISDKLDRQREGKELWIKLALSSWILFCLGFILRHLIKRK